MSGTTLAYRPAGPTLGLSVGATSHAAVAIVLNTSSEVATFVACLNTGTTTVAIKFGVAGAAATLPGDGTTGDYVLAPSMQVPVVLPLPNQVQGSPCQVTAIGSGVGPSLVYVTPLVMQH